MIALGWIKSNYRRWKPFVSNRVHEIPKNTEANNWKHDSSSLNPADLPSRGIANVSNPKLELWKNGPIDLMKNCDEKVVIFCSLMFNAYRTNVSTR